MKTEFPFRDWLALKNSTQALLLEGHPFSIQRSGLS
jgi:hypothetical protein